MDHHTHNGKAVSTHFFVDRMQFGTKEISVNGVFARGVNVELKSLVLSGDARDYDRGVLAFVLGRVRSFDASVLQFVYQIVGTARTNLEDGKIERGVAARVATALAPRFQL